MFTLFTILYWSLKVDKVQENIHNEKASALGTPYSPSTTRCRLELQYKYKRKLLGCSAIGSELHHY